MAGYAYQWLTTWQKSDYIRLRFDYTTKYINAHISGYDCTSIVYTDMAGNTEVKLKYGGQEVMVSRNFLDVFCEDLELFFKNRENTLTALELRYERQYDSEEDINFQRVEVIENQLFRFFENLLKSEASPPKVEQIYMDTNDFGQALRIIRSLNPKVLTLISLEFTGPNIDINEVLSLKEWNRGHRLNVQIRLEKLTSENWNTLGNLLQFTSTFAYFSVSYKTRDEDVVIDPTVAGYFEIREDPEESYIKINPNKWPCSDQEEKVFEDLENIRQKIEHFFYADGDRDHVDDDNEENYEELHDGHSPDISYARYRSDSDSETEMLDYPTCRTWWQLLENRDIMELIIRDMDFFDIQRLRKTCSGIRNCVDLIKPDPHISQYIIRIIGASMIHAEITLANGENRTITHQCIKDEPDFVCTVAKNFSVHLRDQKTCLEELRLEFYYLEWNEDMLAAKSIINWFTESLQGFRRTMKTLTVGKLSIGSINPDETVQILPFVQPEKLEIFDPHFENIYRNYEWNFDVDQISKYWKNAKELIMNTIPVSTPIQEINIDNFVKVDVCLKTISSDDVLFLKNKLLTSSNFQKFKFSFGTSTIDENLHTLIGEPYRNINGVRKIWYFQIGSTDYYMHIVLDTRDSEAKDGVPNNKSIVFSKVAKEATPFF